MWLLMMPLLLQAPTAQSRKSQPPTARQVLEAEHARGGDVSVLMAATRSKDPALQRQAVRALGRFERAALRDSITPLFRAANADVRREAINALGQLNVDYDFTSVLSQERDGRVRAVVYETIGRVTPPHARVEGQLVAGLTDRDSVARIGAARGLEALLRKGGRGFRSAPSTVTAMRTAVRMNRGAELRQLLLIALTTAGDRDSATFAIGLRDPDAQVRRVAVLGSKQWVDDDSPLVRYQALRADGSCERALVAMRDRSEHVALGAIDLMGEAKCAAATYAPELQQALVDGTTWRMRAHALVSLARISPPLAQAALPASASARAWQERVYAATAAKILKDSATLGKLARDSAPNVAIAAMSTTDDALRALSSSHAGLLLAAAAQLKGTPDLATHVPALRTTVARLTAANRSTYRDPIVALSERLREAGQTVAIPPVSAFPVEPLPSDATVRALRGTTVRIRMRALGTITIDLLPDEAPLAVATFVQLAESGKFNGLTLHRIVPNFVVQGGSPGADEFDGVSTGFMRDEVGLARQRRGTLGISTRGRDTGDGQLYFNLVDNFRLDHDYTVFARVTSGLDVMDRIQEGDVMQSIEVIRRK